MLDLGSEGKVLMQLVGIDADDKADGTGKAPTTWISKQLLNTSHRMNPAYQANTEGTGSLGGWEKCEMRTYLKETIKPLIPQTVRDAITPVTKYTKIYQASDETAVNNVTSTEDVWVPSANEVGLSNFESYVRYSGIFTTNASRQRRKVGKTFTEDWWLRSARYSNGFERIYSSGSSGSETSIENFAIALGFCI